MIYDYVIMTKLKAPLFSGTATGQLGKTYSFSRHHGMNVVGKKSTPTDRETQAQIDQREAMKAASAEWDALNLTPLDLRAWYTLAQLRKEKIGGRQMFMKLYVNAYLKGQEWVRFRNMRITYHDATSFTFIVEVWNWALPLRATRSGFRQSGDVYIELTFVGGNDWQGHFDGLQRNQGFHFWPYYWEGGAKYGRSGAYYVRTHLV